jgi:DNA-binding Lrp family transcriptional regulator
MNTDDKDVKELAIVCRELIKDAVLTQRKLSDITGISLGKVNRLLRTGEERDIFRKKGNRFELNQAGLKFMERF